MSDSLVVHANRMDSAILVVINETAKAWEVRNVDCGRSCWLPKSGLRLYKPGVESYEGEYVLAPWLRSKLSDQQEKVLNLLM
jgi:hypothetical protein